MQRILIILGMAIVLLGVLWPFIAKLGLGKLPGDIAIERDNFKFYFPLTTCILISVIVTFLIWLFRR